MQLVTLCPRAWSIIFVLAIFFSSCTSTQLMRIHYQLPAQTDSLQGTKVSLIYRDVRENRDVLTLRAKEEFKDFSGDFTLVVAPEKEDGKLLGAFDLPSLFQEIFKQRLENSGIQVINKAPADIQIEFTLKTFSLDYVDRKWIVAMGYQTRLIQKDKTVVSETVSGQAERLKLIGTKDAETVMSELITDCVNKIDLRQLFEKAQP